MTCLVQYLAIGVQQIAGWWWGWWEEQEQQQEGVEGWEETEVILSNLLLYREDAKAQLHSASVRNTRTQISDSQ